MPSHVVRPGECLSSIARQYGLTWKTLWEDGQNSALRQKREDPNTLMPGDVVFVRDKKDKVTDKGVEARHRFRRSGVPTRLRLRFVLGDKPRANEKYRLVIDGISTQGKLTGEGILEQPIPCNAKGGYALIGADLDRYDFELGTLDPITEITGIQGRLNDLGYYCGPVDGVVGPKTRAAIERFQLEHSDEGLKVTGNLDQPTRDSLKKAYGR